MIEVHNLTMQRGNSIIIDNCSFSLKKGCILGILGANGVGKTTLLNALSGILKPETGKITVNGKIGFVPQLFGAPFTYSVIDIVLMGRSRHMGLSGAPGSRDYKVVRRFLELLGIENLEKRVFNELSGGQRQMTMIAQALSSEYNILILDEPCAALDYKNQNLIVNVMRSLSHDHNVTIIFTTHMLQHAAEIATDVLLMNNSSSFCSGKTSEILNEKHLSQLYDTPIGKAYFSGNDKFTFAPLLDKVSTLGKAENQGYNE